MIVHEKAEIEEQRAKRGKEKGNELIKKKKVEKKMNIRGRGGIKEEEKEKEKEGNEDKQEPTSVLMA